MKFGINMIILPRVLVVVVVAGSGGGGEVARLGSLGPSKGQFFRDRDSFFLVTYIPSLKLAASFPFSKGKYII